MTLSIRTRNRWFALVAALLMAMTVTAMVPAQATPGVPPDITSTKTTNLDPGTTTFVRFSATGVDSPATVTFTGTGVTGVVTSYGSSRIRIQITVDATAPAGLRDMTVINPDGLSDTMLNAVNVTGTTPPPETGEVTGHVFDDANGNGLLDGGETGLANVSVSVTDSLGGGHAASTGADGNFTVASVPTGDASLTYATPAGYALTTGNSSQTVTVVADASVAAADVGYEQIPSGDLSGRVFSDGDGNGVEDGSDTGWSGAAVSVVDANGTTHNAVTDGSGNYLLIGLPVGDATLTYTTPSGATLTTGNASQTVAVVDGGVAAAAAVGYQPPAGTPPDIVSIIGNSSIDPGTTKFMKVTVLNYQTGGTFTVSGTGVTATVAAAGNDLVRISVTADPAAASVPRNLTVTNPDGLSDTLANAITVTGTNPPADSGTVAGRVFEDIDGDGVENGADVGFSGVTVSFVDAAGINSSTTTDAAGNFSMEVGAGVGTLTVAEPAGFASTTGNAVQAVTIVTDTTTNAAPVGFVVEPAAYEDVTNRAGINFVHGAIGCGPPIGVGAAWADIDNDGDQDLYVTSATGSNVLYENLGDVSGDGTVDLMNIAVSLGVDLPGINSFATVFADIDNDGDQDLFVAADSGHVLFRNDLIETGSVGFTDISATSGLTDLGRVQTAAFGDVDNDGNLDLYVAKHGTCADAGDKYDHLYHGNGDGTFSDWTIYLCGGVGEPCDDNSGLGFAPGFFDVDWDGDLDLYLVNDNILNQNQPNKMFRNDGPDGSGGWIFTEIGASNGSGASVNGMGLGIGDPDNDGHFDLAYSDAAPGHLLHNNGDSTFTEISGPSGVSAGTSGDVGWGTAFFDYNNDGWEDLLFAVGPISATTPLANSMLENQGDGTFVDVSEATNMAATEKGRGIALVDMDNDGWVDVFLANHGQAPLLMRNVSGEQGNTNHSLSFTVEGTDSNRDGIGTVIKVTTAAGTQMRLISSGSNHGGGSQKAAFFGLGAETSATVEVIWPNGVTENLGSYAADAAYHLVEPAA